MDEDKPKVGKPRKYKTPEDMQTAIDEYYATCEQKDKGPTITGLALSLGFLSRQALYNYEGYGEDFHYVVKRARLTVEAGYEDNLRKQACAGAIFALKNMKQPWTDKQEVTGKDGAALLAPVIHVQPPNGTMDNTDSLQPDDDKGSIE